MTGFTAPLEGMRLAEASLARTAVRIASANASPEGDSVDLSAEIVALITARNSFQANASVARSMDEMGKALLDVLA